jgi:hypothetical protein
MRDISYKIKAKISGKGLISRTIEFDIETHVPRTHKNFPVHIGNMLRKLVPEKEFVAEVLVRANKQNQNFLITIRPDKICPPKVEEITREVSELEEVKELFNVIEFPNSSKSIDIGLKLREQALKARGLMKASGDPE